MVSATAIREMFARIATRYDVANQIISGGLCRWWLRRLTKLVSRTTEHRSSPMIIADLATGSGDVAFALARALPDAKVNGYDFCKPMLDIALRKRASMGAENPQFEIGDCMALPLADNSVDVVTIAYGVRNFQDRKRGLDEIYRVLRPDGSVFILEFSQPQVWFRPVYYLYLRILLPLIARLATGNKEDYDYLAKSIAIFPNKKNFADELRTAGFIQVKILSLSIGIVAVHYAKKDKK
ncbi:MAG: bifunctional demethylmenaquinone methyltransferase/2-methoxy-6-polyprenyl-1,4-benzoquinol methylase UbiE [Puniceicoccales bacterium]|jgi:demethylmenaquinone methyltransferase/2-methoxy-6-polyprenyl-1,4-benzoquinol methylase|nr:bifunctional demethylmenaquinone methyltransferase/2-methoxy-6-polyprenyl-1,4-benzoquinol methylase UbiE [Puniceicoccales bacterium]